jgi:MFS transporter, DHA1 family, inner membrane transport protein
MRAWISLIALSLSTFIYVTTETLPIGLLPQIAGDLGTTPSAVGLLVTAYALVVVIATLPLTRATHRWPRRRLLVVLLMIFAVANVLSALAPNYPALLGARVVVALSQAVFWAVVVPAAAALFRPAIRGRALGILYAGSSTGPLAGVPAGTWLGQHTDWRVPFLVLSAVGLAILVVLLALLPAGPAGQSDTDRGTAPDTGRYWTLVLVTAVMVTGAFVAFTYITPFLTEVSGFDEAAIGPILLLRGLAGLAGVLVAGLVVVRWPWHSLLVVTVVQAVALIVQYTSGGNGVVAVVAVSAAALALSGMTAVLGTRILQVAPGSTDLASAGMSTAFNVGITGGALIGSLLLTGAGVRSTALVGAVLAVVAVAAVLAEPWLASSQPCVVGGTGPRPASAAH